ncbi:MAG: alpha/beta hydrolase fold domain-containing protein [Xanthomonadales bacterium]|nr:alpha/beta hydrolase fold domain-containing protein [Xanthomonadales bacterium]NIX11714.1 alpha/beta hydrolase fold domain-containing protein [Xanthomonadales bacterium]
MWDLLHPSPSGAEAWVQAVEPTLARLMGDDPLPPLPEELGLWPKGRAPVGGNRFENANAHITVHRPANPVPNGAAAVICPGGGYGGLVTGAEGNGIAKWLNGHGITGIVLRYRLPGGRPSVPLLDAQRAIRTVRARAEEWGCDPQRIGIIGFSAGGHLASTAATQFDDGRADAGDPIERLGSRPDFAILVYPVITMGENTHRGSKRNLLGTNPTPEMIALFSNEKQVTARTSPTFLAHARDDQPVPCANSRMFHQALKTKKVATEYLELPSGGHGLNGYKGPMWDAWQSGALKWLQSLKMIPQ